MSASQQTTKTILLVDDDYGVRSMVRDLLELGRYRVLEAGSGEEALKLGGSFEGHIDLLLTDIVMPGISGADLARRLSVRRPHMGVLYMSAFTRMDMNARHIELQPDVQLLVKPFDLDMLMKRVREALAPFPRWHRPRGDTRPRE